MNTKDPTVTQDPTIAQGLNPAGLASQLFDIALPQCKGNPREASLQVIRFLTESLVFSITVATGDNEISRKGLLKHVGETIIAAPQYPLTSTTPSKP